MDGWTWRLRSTIPNGNEPETKHELTAQMDANVLRGHVQTDHKLNVKLLQEIALRRDARKRRARTAPGGNWAATIKFGTGVHRGGVVADRCILTIPNVQGSFEAKLPPGLSRSWCWAACEGERSKIWFVEVRFRVVAETKQGPVAKAFCLYQGNNTNNSTQNPNCISTNTTERKKWDSRKDRRAGAVWQDRRETSRTPELEAHCVQIGETYKVKRNKPANNSTTVVNDTNYIFVEELELRDEFNLTQILLSHHYRMKPSSPHNINNNNIAQHTLSGGLSSDTKWGNIGEIRHKIQLREHTSDLWDMGPIIHSRRLCLHGEAKGTPATIMVWGTTQVIDGVGTGECRRNRNVTASSIDLLRRLAYEKGGSIPTETRQDGARILKQCGSLVDDSVLEQCPICLEHLHAATVVLLPCLHGGHTKCLTRCLSRNPVCPVCRLDLLPLLHNSHV